MTTTDVGHSAIEQVARSVPAVSAGPGLGPDAQGAVTGTKNVYIHTED